jgi:hypothetical protein
MTQGVVISNIKPNWLLASHATKLKGKELCATLRELDTQEFTAQQADQLKFEKIDHENDHTSNREILTFLGSLVLTPIFAIAGAYLQGVLVLEKPKSEMVLIGRVQSIQSKSLHLLGYVFYLAAVVTSFIFLSHLGPSYTPNPKKTIDRDRIERLKQKITALKTAKTSATAEDKEQINTARQHFQKKLDQLKLQQIKI